MMMRCSASAASTALIDFSRDTESGRMMYGNTTTSFRGRTGRMSGIGRSASRSVESSLSSISAMPSSLLLLLRLNGDFDLFLAQVGNALQDHLEQSVLQLGSGMMGVDRARKRDRLDESAEVALHAEE